MDAESPHMSKALTVWLTARNAVKSCVSPFDKLISRLTLAFTVAAYAYFWVWFFFALAAAPGPQNAIFIMFGTLLALDQAFHCWVLWLFTRMSKLTATRKWTHFRIAMIVTKTPSEPMELLCNTLKCMLDQDYDAPYDVWLADEAPDADMKAWCAEHGVRICSRNGVKTYHRNEWPRRTRCKEGNLAYFYDTYGYDLYDICYQFDSDHAPTSNYISSSIAGFYNDDVGYMAFPSINFVNKSWIGRARTWLEAHYYGPYQASFNFLEADDQFLMPNCTGSHYAVRTSALKAIGGLGPELDEDLSTTMMFMSNGFKGVYSMDTIALGHGPETFESAMVQEYQWSRSAIILFFRWRHIVHATYRHFNLGLWVRAGTTLFWYLSQMLWMVWFVLSAAAGFYFNWCSNAAAPCNLSITNFFLRGMPAVVLAHGYELWCRRRGWLRNGRVKDPPPPIFTPTVFLYRVLRVVWMSAGVVAGFEELFFNKSSHFRVTPKGSNHVPVLSIDILKPLLLLFALLGAAFWLPFAWKDPAELGVAIYLFLCEVGVAMLLAIVIGMHFYENGIASMRNTINHAALIAICVGGLVYTARHQKPFIFNTAAANMFSPYLVVPHEALFLMAVYGIAGLHWLLLAFVA